MRAFPAFHVALMLALLTVPSFVLRGLQWPYHFLIPLAVYAGITASMKNLRGSATWLRRGRLDGKTLALVLLVVAITSLALVAWFRLFKPDVENFRALIPRDSGHLILGGLIFSVGNALLEEIIWRGILLEALAALTPFAALAIGLQAVSFGLQHAEGFPSGAVGVVLATFYGAMLGGLRTYAKGMAAPILAHVFADLTIYLILVNSL